MKEIWKKDAKRREGEGVKRKRQKTIITTRMHDKIQRGEAKRREGRG